MNVLLIDVDRGADRRNTIPNLALMKISAWHKAQGDKVFFGECEKPDHVYAASVFTKNTLRREQVAAVYPNAITGGTGYDLTTELPDEIEVMRPDYDLYDIDYGIGMTSRGCIRKCSFCVVPKKEGSIKSVRMIEKIINPKSRNVTLLDNNFFAQPRWRERIEEIKHYKLKVDFNQGLDIRLLDLEQAQALKDINPPYIRFAFDNVKLEKQVQRGIDLLREVNYSINRNRIGLYVLTGYNSTHEEDLYRCEWLHDQNINTHVQVYEGAPQITRHLARWGNQPRLWAQIAFSQYEPYIKYQEKAKTQALFEEDR